jgi:hypothetical protein
MRNICSSDEEWKAGIEESMQEFNDEDLKIVSLASTEDLTHNDTLRIAR